jgi:hypothetical protein
MPEAAIDEDHEPARCEHEVRPHLEPFADGASADDLLPTPT